jgi:hypothetical protein
MKISKFSNVPFSKRAGKGVDLLKRVRVRVVILLRNS